MLKICLLVLLCVSATLAIRGNKGACKTGHYTPVNVDWNKFLGKWYNVQVS